MSTQATSMDLCELNANRRRHGRVRVCAIDTSLGPAIDVSGGGMRVSCRGRAPKAGAEVVLRMSGLDGQLEALARVCWVRRGGQGCQVGLQFLGLTPELAAQIRSMAIGAASV